MTRLFLRVIEKISFHRSFTIKRTKKGLDTMKTTVVFLPPETKGKRIQWRTVHITSEGTSMR